MRKSLRTLLHYAEDQAEKVINIEDIMVCFAPSRDVRCVTLIRNLTTVPSEEMWKSLVDAEVAEQAKVGMNVDTHDSFEICPSHHVVSDICAQLNEIREPEEISCSVRDLETFLSPHQGENVHEPDNDLDACHITKRTRLTNEIIEPGISRVNDSAFDILSTESFAHVIVSSSSTNDEDIHISSGSDINNLSTLTTAVAESSSSSSGSSSSKARREITRCGDDEMLSLPSPALAERITQIVFEDSGLASGSVIPSNSMPKKLAPQQQYQTYRPIQNQAPFQTVPFSTHFMSSYSDVLLRQQQEQVSRIEAKVNKVTTDTVILSSAPIIASENSSGISGSSHSDGIGNNTCSVAVETDCDVLHPAEQEVHDEQTAHSVAQSAVCIENQGDAVIMQTSTLPTPVIGDTALSAGDISNSNSNSMTNRNSNSMTNSNSNSMTDSNSNSMTNSNSNSNSNSMTHSNSNSNSYKLGYQADLQDPLHFAEWPSWIWSRVHSHPLPLPHVIAGALSSSVVLCYVMLCCAVLCCVMLYCASLSCAMQFYGVL